MKIPDALPQPHQVVAGSGPCVRPSSGRRAGARLAAACLIVVVLTACDPQRPPTASAPTPTGAASVPATARTEASDTPPVTPEHLTAAQLSWLDAASALQRKADDAVGAQPNGSQVTTAQLRAIVNALHGCTRDLDRIGVPDDRLRPVYRIVRQECAQYDKVAACYETIAAVPATLGVHAQRQLRQLNEAADCITAGMLNAGNLLASAEAKSTDIKAESFDLLGSCAPGAATATPGSGEVVCTGR